MGPHRSTRGHTGPGSRAGHGQTGKGREAHAVLCSLQEGLGRAWLAVLIGLESDCWNDAGGLWGSVLAPGA